MNGSTTATSTEERRVQSSSDRGITPSHKTGGVTSPGSLKKRAKEFQRVGEVLGGSSTPPVKIIQHTLQNFRRPKLNSTISHVRFERYAEYYNDFYTDSDGKPELTEHLRLPHLTLFKHLVNIAFQDTKEHLEKYSRDYKFEVGEYFEIRTNRPYLCKCTGQLSGTSIRRQLQRLEKAGVIKTVFHGRENNFSVLIDSQFLSFHESKANPHNEIVNAPNETICIPYSPELRRKLEINVDNSTSCIKPEQLPEQHKNPQEHISGNCSANNQTGTPSGTTQGHTGTQQEPLREQGTKCEQLTPVINKETAPCKEVPRENDTDLSAYNPVKMPRYEIDAAMGKVESYALSSVHWIFAIIMEKLYTEKDLVPSEIVNAQKMIYMQVFRHLNSFQAVDSKMAEWKWRVQKIADLMTSRRYSHKGKWIPPVPTYYFDEELAAENKVNFAWSAPKWHEHLKKQQNKRIHKELVKRKRTDNETLYRCLVAVGMNPTQNVIKIQYDFLRHNYGHLLKHFKVILSDPQFLSILRKQYDDKRIRVSIKQLLING